MNDILLVGNGFDLAHGLLTNYNDFLFIMKEWSCFQDEFGNVRGGKCIEETNPFARYLLNADKMDEQNISKLGNIIQKNSWVKYFCKCGAEIDGWIDFEREIYPVIELFEFVFHSSYVVGGNTEDEYGEASIERKSFSSEMIRKAILWGKYISVIPDRVIVKKPFVSMRYGILKKKIMEALRKEFDEFIEAYELYLMEFVHKNTDVDALHQIKKLNINTVISFNYTMTEKIYGISEDNVHHIHGMIRDCLSDGKNNMVMGINEQKNSNMDFIYFVKYFQRIQKASGVKYKSFIRNKVKNNCGIVEKEKYNLYIYGHSLDETDEDILRYVIGDLSEKGQLKLNPQQVIIFYYNPSDFEQKVINLINLYGRSIVEEYIEKELFKFVEISDEAWSE